MSFSPSQETQSDQPLIIEPHDRITQFEKHIIQCCKATEWDLRKKLSQFLIRAGFTIKEDQYRTERCSFDKRYESVHNMLAIRGNPRVCLVAHTDVCREHDEANSRKYEEYPWMAPTDAKRKRVDPVVKKILQEDGTYRRIIQDKECNLQTGGDDRLGVAINTSIALNTGYDMALFFPTDEEIGLKSSRACEMKELADFDLLVQTDRGNHSNELVVKIGNTLLCGWETTTRLLEIAFDSGLPRTPVTGLSTDVAALIDRGKAKEAVNMTCGYHESHGSSSAEYIECSEAKDTMKYVERIVRDYYLE